MFTRNYLNKNTYLEISRLSKETFWVVLGQVSVIIGNFILLSRLTKILSPLDYGNLSIMLSIIGLSNTLVLGAINNSISRFYSISIEENSFNNYKRDSINLIFLAIAFLGVFYLTVLIYLIYLNEISYAILAIGLFSYTIFFSFYNSIITVFNASRKRISSVVLSNIEVWIKIIIVSLLFYIGLSELNYLLLSYLVSIILVVFLGYLWLNRIFISNPSDVNHYSNNTYKKEMIRFSLPYIYWGGFVSLQQVSDRFSLSYTRGSVDVGQYSVLFQLGYTPFIMFFSVVTSIVTPIIYMKAGNLNNQSKMKEVNDFFSVIFLIVLFFGVIGFLIAFYFHEFLFRIAVGNEFRGYSYLMPYIIIPACLTSLAELLGVFFSTIKNQNKIIGLKIFISIFAIIANLLGAFYYGITGIIIALNMFSVLYLILMYHAYSKVKF